MRSKRGFYAVGSGSHLALGALEAGASPKQAIKIASRYDSGTNNDVRVLKIKNTAKGTSTEEVVLS
jgi:hypothetical protein